MSNLKEQHFCETLNLTEKESLKMLLARNKNTGQQELKVTHAVSEILKLSEKYNIYHTLDIRVSLKAFGFSLLEFSRNVHKFKVELINEATMKEYHDNIEMELKGVIQKSYYKPDDIPIINETYGLCTEEYYTILRENREKKRQNCNCNTSFESSTTSNDVSEQLKNLLKEKNETTDLLKSMSKERTDTSEQLKNFKKERNDLSEQLRCITSDSNNILKGLKDELKNVRKESNEITEQLKSMSKERNNISEHLKNLVKERSDLSEKLKKLTEERNNLSEQLRNITSDSNNILIELKNELKNVRKESDEIKNLSKERNEITEQLKSMSKERNYISDQLKNLMQERSDISEQLKKLTEDRNDLSEQLRNMTEEKNVIFEEVKDKLQSVRKEGDDILEKLKNVSNEKSDVPKQLNLQDMVEEDKYEVTILNDTCIYLENVLKKIKFRHQQPVEDKNLKEQQMLQGTEKAKINCPISTTNNTLSFPEYSEIVQKEKTKEIVTVAEPRSFLAPITTLQASYNLFTEWKMAYPETKLVNFFTHHLNTLNCSLFLECATELSHIKTATTIEYKIADSKWALILTGALKQWQFQNALFK